MAGIDEYTVLMLHMDGADESTTFTDSSASGHTVTAQNDAQIDTAQYKFGQSGVFDGNGDYLYIHSPLSADFAFGDLDFTIDTWVRFNALPSVGKASPIVSQYSNGSNYWYLRVLNDGGTYKLHFRVDLSGWTIIETTTIGSSLNTGQWYHVALVRYGTSFVIFLDGVSAASCTDSSTFPNYMADALKIGWSDFPDITPTLNYLDGHIDEFRISKGIARWTENFAVPTEAYSEEEGEEAMGIHTVRANRARFGNDFTANYLDINAGVVRLYGTAKRTLVERPVINHGLIGVKTKPVIEVLGANTLYVMPIWSSPTNADEQLFFRNIVPSRWDGASDIHFFLKVALGGAEDVGDKAQFQLSWANNDATGVLASGTTDTTAELTVVAGRTAQYDIYVLDFTLDWDLPTLDVAGRQGLVGRIRRIAASANEVAASPYISNWYLRYTVDKIYSA